MPGADIEVVRSFNRTVTERIGALRDDYLERGRPLGASRVLWEVPPEGADTRTLRLRLGLDSGYLSRLLRVLERDGLVTMGRHSGDGRVRTVQLTPAGMAERRALDASSNELATSMLTPLDDREQATLLAAMATVERLLTAASVEVTVDPPTTTDAMHCLSSYFAELDERFDGGFDVSHALPTNAADLTEPRGLLLIARLRGRPIGCGALKLHGAEPAEIKRVWVDREARGLGLGRRLLRELETLAAAHGAPAVRLDTNRTLTQAIALYRATGYIEIDPFNDEPYAHHWFEKRLP